MSKDVLQINDYNSEEVMITPSGPCASSNDALSSSLCVLSNNVGQKSVIFDRAVWCAGNQSVTVLLCPAETVNKDQVIPLLCRPGEALLCFSLIHFCNALVLYKLSYCYKHY